MIDLGPNPIIKEVIIRALAFSDIVEFFHNEAICSDTDVGDLAVQELARKVFENVPLATLHLARDVAARQLRDDEAELARRFGPEPDGA